MQLPEPLRIFCAGTAVAAGTTVALALAVAVLAAGGASAAQAVHPASDGPSIRALRGLTDHYRTLTWEYESSLHARRTPTSFAYRRSRDRHYLRWTIDRWTRQAYKARSRALAALHRRLAVSLPRPPGLRASRYARLSYSRRLALRLRKIYPGHASRAFARARAKSDRATLRLWQQRSAAATVAVALHARRRARIAPWLSGALLCIHGYEAGWSANTGNGYYGGLQMDSSFMRTYGGEFVRRWGTADNWPVWAQLETSARAYRSGRGFTPWPNTARACGLL